MCHEETSSYGAAVLMLLTRHLARLTTVKSASCRCLHPAHEAVRYISSVAVSRNALPKIARRIHTVGIVCPRCLAKGTCIAAARSIDQLSETRSASSPSGTLADHACDLILGAERLYLVVVVAGRLAVMVLHEAGVADTVVGGVDSDAAFGLLHDDGEDEAMIDLRGLSDRFDRGLDICVLFVCVGGNRELSAGGLHEGLIRFEHLVVGYPIGLRRLACTSGTVTAVHLVRIAARALSIVVVDLQDRKWAVDRPVDADRRGGPVT